MRRLTIIAAFLFSASLFSFSQNQNGMNGSTSSGSGAPAGNCTSVIAFYVNTSNGNLYDCPTPGSSWVLTGGGGTGNGTVTSVTFTGDGTVLSATPSSAVTISGTVTAALATPAANTVLSNNTSGAAAPAFNTQLLFGNGACSAGNVPYSFINATGTGLYYTGSANVPAVCTNGGATIAFTAGAQATSTGLFKWSNSGTITGTTDTGLSRGTGGLVDVGNGSAASTAGFIKTAQSIAVVTADVTCGTGGTLAPCTSFTTITGLSLTLPSLAANWEFECDLIVGQATAGAANQIGVQTATNGATNIAASGIAYSAAGTSTSAAITGVASTTTAQSIITWTPGGTGTKLPVHIAGTIEGASVSGTTLNITVLTGAAADLLTIYRGSKCWVH